MPRWIVLAAWFAAALALTPFALIAKARGTKSPIPRIHPIQDMDNQPRFKAQQTNPLFRDGRAMRPAIPGAVARGQLNADEFFYRGLLNNQWATAFPIEIDDSAMRRGQQRFAIYCAPCHGLLGKGDGIVAARADRLQEGTWVAPANYHTDLIRQRPNGHLFNTITNGIRTMPSYSRQIPEDDRWRIVAYIRALQRSQGARLRDVPLELQPSLR